jgi:hypothetical protein
MASSSNATLYYFPANGRTELARMLCAVGKIGTQTL